MVSQWRIPEQLAQLEQRLVIPERLVPLRQIRVVLTLLQLLLEQALIVVRHLVRPPVEILVPLNLVRQVQLVQLLPLLSHPTALVCLVKDQQRQLLSVAMDRYPWAWEPLLVLRQPQAVVLQEPLVQQELPPQHQDLLRLVPLVLELPVRRVLLLPLNPEQQAHQEQQALPAQRQIPRMELVYLVRVQQRLLLSAVMVQ